jgi:outer membrane protein OmpA-like peptidoglycan-associated protein
MVAPTATPSSSEFNLKVATPLANPAPPALQPVPVLPVPPPPAQLEGLPIPDPVTLAALPPLAAPPPPPQRGKPIPPPAGPLHDSVSALEAPPPAAAQHLPITAPPANSSGASATTPNSFRLVFSGSSTDLPDSATALLQQLAGMMVGDPHLRLKLNSFASGSTDNPVAARRLSLQRALKLREALVGLGISSLRVDVLALGMTATGSPADRIDIVTAN